MKSEGRGTKDEGRISKKHPPLYSSGVTLVELLVAGTLALVVVLAIGQIDVTRILLGGRTRTAALTSSDADFALLHMARELEQADRISVVSSGPPNGNIQFRVPRGNAFDSAGDYVWKQYRQTGTEIRFYDPASSCTVALTFKDISQFAVWYIDESPAPPGGDPPGQNDSNVLKLDTFWADPLGTRWYTGEVTIRSAAYTNIPTGLQNPWVADVSPPPTPCT